MQITKHIEREGREWHVYLMVDGAYYLVGYYELGLRFAAEQAANEATYNLLRRAA